MDQAEIDVGYERNKQLKGGQMKDQSILLTGGTGSFGKQFVRDALKEGDPAKSLSSVEMS